MTRLYADGPTADHPYVPLTFSRSIALTWLAGAVCFAAAVSVPLSTIAANAKAAPSRQVALGVSVAGDDNATALSAYRKAAGANPSIVMWFQDWSEPLYWSSQMPWNDAVGATPMITWDPANANGGIPLADITAGDYNTYIDQSAQLAKNYGKPMLIRFAHEMNLPSSPFGPGHKGDTPAQYVAAWRHVVNRFASDGVTNVRWVWSPNVNTDGGTPFDSYYPGNAWVDYVALDGYNFSTIHHTPWMSFAKVFDSSYVDITRLSPKPVIIAETASASSPGSKAGWIRYAFLTVIPEQFPRVVAAVWFDRVKETDWRINSSASTLAAWRTVVHSPVYGSTFNSAVDALTGSPAFPPTGVGASPAPSSSPTGPTSTSTPGPAPTATKTLAPTTLRIGRIKYAMSASAVKRNHRRHRRFSRNRRLNEQTVTIRNIGSKAISIKGWTIIEQRGRRFHFPAATLRPQQQLVLHTGRGRDHGRQLYWRRTRPVWRAPHDRARLLDRDGKTIQSCAWHHRGAGVRDCPR